ncbi:hypothetical protein [Lysobacter enzymogenes]|uniref:hypothetical protein n=1 Tax=Lysobacter enzymogenes TaxID=69 RepID=UPI001A979F6F|nr:hypothetical protein [Lysobacter enzymogenes]QQP97947.1 hypothetical protein JHW38_08070 [Lysobacter enzymogenes]
MTKEATTQIPAAQGAEPLKTGAFMPVRQENRQFHGIADERRWTNFIISGGAVSPSTIPFSVPAAAAPAAAAPDKDAPP